MPSDVLSVRVSLSPSPHSGVRTSYHTQSHRFALEVPSGGPAEAAHRLIASIKEAMDTFKRESGEPPRQQSLLAPQKNSLSATILGALGLVPGPLVVVHRDTEALREAGVHVVLASLTQQGAQVAHAATSSPESLLEQLLPQYGEVLDDSGWGRRTSRGTHLQTLRFGVPTMGMRFTLAVVDLTGWDAELQPACAPDDGERLVTKKADWLCEFLFPRVDPEGKVLLLAEPGNLLLQEMAKRTDKGHGGSGLTSLSL